MRIAGSSHPSFNPQCIKLFVYASFMNDVRDVRPISVCGGKWTSDSPWQNETTDKFITLATRDY